MNTCEWCGQTIITLRTDAKYCTGAHRVAAHRLQKRIGGLPSRLAKQNRWVRYDANKVPLNASTGQNASSTDASTWANYATASKSNVGIGLGYVLGEGIGCIDLDKCVANGILSDEAQKVVDEHPSNYIEVSPSGNGLHIWGLREEQPGTRQIIDGLHIEVYSIGRYITITGNVFQHGGLEAL